MKRFFYSVFVICLILEITKIGFLRINTKFTNKTMIENLLLIHKNKINFNEYALKFMTNIELNNPTSILKNNLYYDKKIEVPTMYLSNNKKYNIDNQPIIYLYNTHQTEKYKPSINNDYKVKPTVYEASMILKEILNTKNIKTIIEEGSIPDLLNANGWDYSYSYQASRYYIKETIKKYPNLKLIIDIHRDSVNHKASTIKLNNKNYAKVLFVLGLKNQNNQKNLEKMNNLNQLINKNYPGLSRGIIKKEGKYVNGIYNQDIKDNIILLELGGDENNLEEVTNTCIALSNILEIYLKENKYE